MKNKNFNLVFLLVFFLMFINYANSSSINDLVNSYDYSYTTNQFNISNISISNKNNTNIVFNLDIVANEGDYEFIYGVLDKNVETYKDEFKNLNKIHSNVNLSLSLKYLKFENYSLNLQVYKNNELVFRKYNSFNFNINSSSFSLNSSKVENNQTFILLNKNNIIENNNQIIFSGNNMVRTQDNLVKNLLLSFKTNISNGKYNLSYKIIDDLSDQIILDKQEIQVLNSSFILNISSNKLYNKNVNDKLYLNYLSLSNSTFESSISNQLIFENFSNYNFKNSNYIDLSLQNISYNISSGKTIITIKNLGDITAFNFNLVILDNNFSKILDYKILNLSSNSSRFLNFTINKNLTNFVVYLDYYNFVEEDNKNNNILSWPIEKVNGNGDGNGDIWGGREESGEVRGSVGGSGGVSGGSWSFRDNNRKSNNLEPVFTQGNLVRTKKNEFVDLLDLKNNIYNKNYLIGDEVKIKIENQTFSFKLNKLLNKSDILIDLNSSSKILNKNSGLFFNLDPNNNKLEISLVNLSDKNVMLSFKLLNSIKNGKINNSQLKNNLLDFSNKSNVNFYKLYSGKNNLNSNDSILNSSFDKKLLIETISGIIFLLVSSFFIFT